MRLALLLSLALFNAAAAAQPNLWARVPTQFPTQRLSPTRPSPPQLKSFSAQLRKPGALDEWGCEGKDDFDEMLNGLKFSAIPLSPSRKVLLVEAGGCARGGPGSMPSSPPPATTTTMSFWAGT